jgi:hypothetical protein
VWAAGPGPGPGAGAGAGEGGSEGQRNRAPPADQAQRGPRRVAFVFFGGHEALAVYKLLVSYTSC